MILEAVILEHMGKLHPFEQVLVLLLAFGPILLLGVTIWIARKRIDDEEPGD